MNVDVIGKDGVSKFISTSKLTKFVIYRQNARSGSTPVFDGSHCNTVAQVVSTFQIWADNILSANPGNNMPYEMLLFSKTSDIDDDLDADDTDDTPRKQKAGKMKKIRFSFCLAGYNYGQQQGHVNVADAIKQALDQRDRENELTLLRAEVAELREQMSGDDEDEEEKPSAFWQAVEMLKNGTHKKQAAQIAGEAATAKRYTDEEKKRLQDALKVLRKHSNNLPRDLELLAKFADKNPTMFANYMQTLRNSV